MNENVEDITAQINCRLTMKLNNREFPPVEDDANTQTIYIGSKE